MRRSVRARLTMWYAALTFVALLIVAISTWALFRLSVVTTAQDRLDAHLAGVERFSDEFKPGASLDHMREEYREYSDMSHGNALFQVTTGSGDVLVAPDAAGWASAVAPFNGRSAVGGEDILVNGEPYRASITEFAGNRVPIRAIIAVPLGPSLTALVHMRQLLLWLLPAITALAACCGYVVSRRALRPVDLMAQHAREIHVGNLTRRIDEPAADDELRRLAVTFNGMLARLEAGVMNISRFTSEASHELRTPVAIVRTTAELALRRDREPDEYRRALSEIQAQATQMSDLVDDLLTVARADAGVEAPPDSRVDLAIVAANAIATCQGTHGGRRSVELVPPVAPVIVPADARQLQRLITILCDNAMKYTPADGSIRMRLDESPDRVAIVVEDEGIGVAAGDLPRVFERFYRGTDARARAASGSGLGLAIALAIAQRHGGDIRIESPINPHSDRPHSDRPHSDRPGTRVTATLLKPGTSFIP